MGPFPSRNVILTTLAEGSTRWFTSVTDGYCVRAPLTGDGDVAKPCSQLG